MHRLTKAGIVAYVLWGILHFALGVLALIGYATGGRQGMLLKAFGIASDPGPFVANIVLQHSINVSLFGVLGIVVALTLIRQQEPLGFWLNFGLLGVADVVFVMTLVVPGHIPVAKGAVGPLLFVIAAVLTGLGLRAARSPAVERGAGRRQASA